MKYDQWRLETPEEERERLYARFYHLQDEEDLDDSGTEYDSSVVEEDGDELD